MSRSPLHYLEAIIRTGSIAAASKQLFLTQPSLSLYVKRLEEEYDYLTSDEYTKEWLTETTTLFNEEGDEV